RRRERAIEQQAIAPDHVDAQPALQEHGRSQRAAAERKVTGRREHYLHSSTAGHDVCWLTHAMCCWTLAALFSTSCSSAAHAAMHSFSSNGLLLPSVSMHSASRLHTSLQAVLRGSVQPAAPPSTSMAATAQAMAGATVDESAGARMSAEYS